MTPRKRPQRAAIYARQSVAEPEGIARQVEACRQLAESRDYEVAEVYVDDAVIVSSTPALLVFARLMQGLSVGGEYGASATYLSEMAGKDRRGFFSAYAR